MPGAEEAQPEAGLTRRDFLVGAGIAAGLLVVGGIISHEALDDDPTPAERDITEGIDKEWDKLSVFAGGVVLGSSVELNRSPDFSGSRRIDWPFDGHALGVRRPVMVGQSAALNGYNNREIDAGTIGFWLPEGQDLVFARYNPGFSIYPIHTGHEAGYTDAYRHMLGETVEPESSPHSPDNPRHFIIERPEYEDRDSQVRRKDIGQSVALAPNDSRGFVNRLRFTFGGFEIRDWAGEERGKVSQGEFDSSFELSPELTAKIDEGLRENWDNINGFAGILAVNASSKVYSDARLLDGSEVEWPRDFRHAVVVRPMSVVGSSRLNLTDDERKEVEKGVKRTTVAFWLPGPNQFVYMDTQDESGNILASTRGHYPNQVKSDGILGYDFQLDGRQKDGGAVYPYFEYKYEVEITEGGRQSDGSYEQSVYEERTGKALVGHSLGMKDGVSALDIVADFSDTPSSQPLTID